MVLSCNNKQPINDHRGGVLRSGVEWGGPRQWRHVHDFIRTSRLRRARPKNRKFTWSPSGVHVPVPNDLQSFCCVATLAALPSLRWPVDIHGLDEFLRSPFQWFLFPKCPFLSRARRCSGKRSGLSESWYYRHCCCHHHCRCRGGPPPRGAKNSESRFGTT